MIKKRNLGIGSTIVAFGLISLLVFSPFATAQSNGGGNPFDAIWDAITDLQNQIDEIEQTPGQQGPPGNDGQDGSDGSDGLSCWDLDGDGVTDENEDINEDGNFDALDCKGPQGEQGPAGEDGEDGNDGNDADVTALQAQVDELIEENEAQQDEIDDLLARIEALEADGGSDPDPDDVDDDSDGFTENQGDCNDSNSAVNPDATELDNDIDDDCDGQVDEGFGGGGGDIIVASGTFTVGPVPVYECAFGLVDFAIDEFLFSDSGSNLTVTAPNSGFAYSMNGPSASNGTISVSVVIAGSTTETYSLTGGFVDDDTWTGTFSAEYAGGSTDCTNQSWDVTGERVSGSTLFVATSGDDSDAGTQQAPLQTINAAIIRAVTLDNIQSIHISEGLYNERVMLANGIDLFGGFSAANGWVRDISLYETTITNSAVSEGRINAVFGSGILAETTVDGFTIMTDDALGTNFGISNYAFYCTSCSGLTISNNIIIAGNGGPGISGINGTPGLNGGIGQGGTNGSCDDQNAIGQGGNGGTSSVGLFGGKGGNGGSEANDGQDGSPGSGGAAGGAGGNGDTNGDDGFAGQNGANGIAGGNGAGGSGGLVIGGFWTGSSGTDGALGTSGNGGGGGGGGGGQGGTFVIDGAGNGGGGGGAGGSRGTPGTGGTAGGGSFGLFLLNSDGVQVVNNQITSGTGGNGGAGGTGGSGGQGGQGGFGARNCLDEIGAGGNGGSGGDGGNGGHGSGGAGGSSFAVYRSNTTVDTAENTLSNGSGGAGGSSPGNDGVTGASGTTN